MSTGLRGCAVHGPRKSGADHRCSASEWAPPPSRTVANIHQRPPHSISVASLATTPSTRRASSVHENGKARAR